MRYSVVFASAFFAAAAFAQSEESEATGAVRTFQYLYLSFISCLRLSERHCLYGAANPLFFYRAIHSPSSYLRPILLVLSLASVSD